MTLLRGFQRRKGQTKQQPDENKPLDAKGVLWSAGVHEPESKNSLDSHTLTLHCDYHFKWQGFTDFWEVCTCVIIAQPDRKHWHILQQWGRKSSILLCLCVCIMHTCVKACSTLLVCVKVKGQCVVFLSSFLPSLVFEIVSHWTQSLFFVLFLLDFLAISSRLYSHNSLRYHPLLSFWVINLSPESQTLLETKDYSHSWTFFLFKYLTFELCVYVCICVGVCAVAHSIQRESWIPWSQCYRWLWATRHQCWEPDWVLGKRCNST